MDLELQPARAGRGKSLHQLELSFARLNGAEHTEAQHAPPRFGLISFFLDRLGQTDRVHPVRADLDALALHSGPHVDLARCRRWSEEAVGHSQGIHREARPGQRGLRVAA